MIEWIMFIADALMFLGDVVGLAINVVWSVLEAVIAFLRFVSQLIITLQPYGQVITFMGFGLSIFALYVVKAIFGR